MPGKKRVAILGAGISGLAAIKSCLEEGLEPTCFEQSDDVGGIWYYTPEYHDEKGSKSFDRLTANVSKEFFAYSDFPYPRDAPPFPTHSEVHKYLRSYSQTFGLQKYISFNTRVTKLQRSRDYDVTGTWEVEIVTNNGSPTRQVFDCVMICTGVFSKPSFGNVKGIETFKGDLQHSAAYRNGEKYRNKRVVVVGNGNSSGDLAAGAACFADQVFYSVGAGMWMIPRFMQNGIPYDYKLITRPAFNSQRKLDDLFYDLSSSRFNLEHSGLFPSTMPANSQVVVNDEVQNFIMNGKIKIYGRLVRLGPREAEFDDGSVVHDVDAVLFATGYKLSLDFLDENIAEENGKLSLYKMLLPLQLPHPSLVLIGCMDVFGSNPPIFELQCRLSAQVFAGRKSLPSKHEMTQDVVERNNLIFQQYGRYKYWLPTFPFRDELAKEVGVSPSWLDLIKAGPKLAYNYLYGPAFAYQDRLWGPHPWSGARKAIDEALEQGYYAKQPRQCNPPKVTKSSMWISATPFVLALTGAALFIRYRWRML